MIEESSKYVKIILRIWCENERLKGQAKVHENMNIRLHERVNEVVRELSGVNVTMAEMVDGDSGMNDVCKKVVWQITAAQHSSDCRSIGVAQSGQNYAC